MGVGTRSELSVGVYSSKGMLVYEIKFATEEQISDSIQNVIRNSISVHFLSNILRSAIAVSQDNI